jgi:hypothetical protein
MLIGKVNWNSKRVLTQSERDTLNEKLSKDYYVILSMHRGHLSVYFIQLAHWILSKFKKPGYYGHSFMNLEDTVDTTDDFRFIESTDTGVHYSGFNDVFDQQCSSVALLKPKNMTLEDWTAALDKAKTELGKPYDTLFDLSQDQNLSCVELVRAALMGDNDYDKNFAQFEAMIAQYGMRLDPQTFYECPDFEVVWEVRH